MMMMMMMMMMMVMMMILVCAGRSWLLNWTKMRRTSRTHLAWCRSTRSCWRRTRVCPRTTRSAKNSWSWYESSNRRDRARPDETHYEPLLSLPPSPPLTAPPRSLPPALQHPPALMLCSHTLTHTRFSQSSFVKRLQLYCVLHVAFRPVLLSGRKTSTVHTFAHGCSEFWDSADQTVTAPPPCFCPWVCGGGQTSPGWGVSLRLLSGRLGFAWSVCVHSSLADSHTVLHNVKTKTEGYSANSVNRVQMFQRSEGVWNQLYSVNMESLLCKTHTLSSNHRIYLSLLSSWARPQVDFL